MSLNRPKKKYNHSIHTRLYNKLFNEHIKKTYINKITIEDLLSGVFS